MVPVRLSSALTLLATYVAVLSAALLTYATPVWALPQLSRAVGGESVDISAVQYAEICYADIQNLRIVADSMAVMPGGREAVDSLELAYAWRCPPRPYAFRINAGGPDYTDTQGKFWRADIYYVGGTPWGVGDEIFETDDDPLYQTERYGAGYSYEIPLSNASYRVVLHFAENFFESSGSRIFDVLAEGQTAIDDLDIYAEVGHDVALTYAFNVQVSDGTLNLDLQASVNNAKLSAIEVLRPVSGDIARTPGFVDFGSQEVGTSSEFHEITLKNTSSGTLTVFDVFVEGMSHVMCTHFNCRYFGIIYTSIEINV